MAAGAHDFTIEQGVTFRNQITYKDAAGAIIDLTGYTARMQIRSSVDAATFEQELSTANGGITMGGVLGTIDLFISDVNTDALTIATGVYDLEIIDTGGTGDVTRLLEGKIKISKAITR